MGRSHYFQLTKVIDRVNERVKRFYEALEKQQEPPAIELNFDTLDFQFPATQEGLQFPEGMPAWKFPQFPPSQDDSVPGPTTPPIFQNDVELQRPKQEIIQHHSVPSDTVKLESVRKHSPSIIQYEVYDANVVPTPAVGTRQVVEQVSPSIPFEVYNSEFLPSLAMCYHCRSSEHLAHACFKRVRYFKSFNIVVRERKCMYAGEF